MITKRRKERQTKAAPGNANKEGKSVPFVSMCKCEWCPVSLKEVLFRIVRDRRTSENAEEDKEKEEEEEEEEEAEEKEEEEDEEEEIVQKLNLRNRLWRLQSLFLPR